MSYLKRFWSALLHRVSARRRRKATEEAIATTVELATAMRQAEAEMRRLATLPPAWVEDGKIIVNRIEVRGVEGWLGAPMSNDAIRLLNEMRAEQFSTVDPDTLRFLNDFRDDLQRHEDMTFDGEPLIAGWLQPSVGEVPDTFPDEWMGT